MRRQTQVDISRIATASLLCLLSMLSCAAGFAADKPSDTFCENGFAKDGTCLKAQPDDIRALHIVLKYCEIAPRREIRGNVLDPNLTDKQAAQARADQFNGSEKKLLSLRQELIKLNHADVDKILHDRMATLAPDDPYDLECLLEIVARSFPQEFDDYQKLIAPGIDTADTAEYVKGRFLGKSASMQEPPDKT